MSRNKLKKTKKLKDMRNHITSLYRNPKYVTYMILRHLEPTNI